MAVTKEFRCLAHGAFEGTDARCPHGCTTVIREFRTAPGSRSAKTKASDTALERMAKRYQLSDISAKSGSVAGDRAAKMRGLGQVGPADFTPRWMEIPKGGTYDAATKQVIARDGSEGGADALVKNLSQGRAEPLGADAPALPIGPIPRRPRPVVVGRDSVTRAQFKDALAKAS